MKRFLIAASLLAAMAGSAGATAIAYDQNLVNEVVTTTKTYTIDMSASVIDLLSAEATMSSATPTASTFNDGTQSTGSVVVTATATLKGAAATDTLTVNVSSDLAGASGTNTVTVSSNGAGPLTGASITLGAEGNTFVFTQGMQWAIGTSSAATATSIAAAINNQRYWTAAAGTGASLGKVTITCSTPGSACNGYTLVTSTPTALVRGAATFSGGVDNTYFLINSQMYIQGVDWTADVSFASNTAVSIKNAINSLDTQGVTASTTSSTVVTITASAVGTAANSFTLSSSRNSSLTRGVASFSGGRAHASFCIGANCLTEGTDWAVGASTNATASNINTAVTNSSNTIGVTSTVLTGNTVKFTSISAGLASNYRLTKNQAAGLTLSGNAMTGGTDSALSGNVITIANHGLTTGMQVLYSTGTTGLITGLTNQTTYYAIVLTGNTLELSLTSTGSYAGAAIALTAPTPSTTTHSFTLTPLSLTGTLVVQWQASVDGSNWANLSLSAMSFASPYTTASTVWDFSAVNYKYIRANVAGPTRGGALLVLHAFGKRYGSGL